jgi:hypothetical protein
MWVTVAGITVSLLDFSIYFEIEKDYPVWTGPDQARPVPDCQSGAWSSPTFWLDRTGPSPTPDRVRPDWWNHCCQPPYIQRNSPTNPCARTRTNTKSHAVGTGFGPAAYGPHWARLPPPASLAPIGLACPHRPRLPSLASPAPMATRRARQ